MNLTPRRKPAYLLTALLACPLAVAGPAADSGPADNDEPRAFSIHDLDRDGRLSREEYRQFLARTEQRRQAEGHTGRPRRPPLRFHEIDSNRDNYLDEDEMISALNKRLERHRQGRNRGGRW